MEADHRRIPTGGLIVKRKEKIAAASTASLYFFYRLQTKISVTLILAS
jgi:hypothetical protein